MAKFCGKCGAKLDETTGLCPHCDAQIIDTKKEEPKPERKPRKQRKPGNKKLKIIITVAVALVFALSVLGILALSGIFDHYDVPAVDAEDYYKENGDIVRKISVKNSKDVQTEAQTVQDLADRGFEEVDVTCPYSMDGELQSDARASGTADTQHPVYEMRYYSEESGLWTISIINGQITAYPATYNVQTGTGVPVILAESGTITSYDSQTNKFYETIPLDTALKVLVVDRIDVNLLNDLTFEEIGGLAK